MKPLLTTHRPALIAALLALLMFTSLACSFGTLTIGKNSATLDITLKEDEINQLFNSITVDNQSDRDQLLDKVTGVEMHDGFIRVLGTKTAANGSEVKGSYDVSFSAENDALKVKIIAVDIAGIEVGDAVVTRINQKISDSLNHSMTESHGEVLYKEVSVSEGLLKIKIQVNYEK